MSRLNRKLLSLLLPICLLLSLLSCAPQGDPPPEGLLSTDQYNQYVHPCELPEDYVYPKGTAQYYIDHGIWLEEGFYRPDLIWIGNFDFDDSVPSPGEIRYDHKIWKRVGDENSRYAVNLHFYSNYDKEALADYLTSLGWERLENGYNWAATRRQIESLDCIAVQNAIGCSTSNGIRIHTPYQTFHTHAEKLPQGHVYSCAHPFE